MNKKIILFIIIIMLICCIGIYSTTNKKSPSIENQKVENDKENDKDIEDVIEITDENQDMDDMKEEGQKEQVEIQEPAKQENQPVQNLNPSQLPFSSEPVTLPEVLDDED